MTESQEIEKLRAENAQLRQWYAEVIGSVAPERLESMPHDALVNEELQSAMLNPATQVMFRAGLLACREYMASFVAAEDPGIAASIRANWWPSLGRDPGRPRRLHWSDVYLGEYPDGRAKTKDEVSPSIEALVQAMMFLHRECGWPISHECFGESSEQSEGGKSGG